MSSVRLGEWDTTTTQDCDDSLLNERVCSLPHVDVAIVEKIVHNLYEANSRNQHHDIALLRMARKIEYTEFIKPICLPVDSSVRSLSLSDVVLTVAGWGKKQLATIDDESIRNFFHELQVKRKQDQQAQRNSKLKLKQIQMKTATQFTAVLDFKSSMVKYDFV